MSFVAIAIGGAAVIGGGVALYEGEQNRSLASGIAGDVEGKQDYYNSQLMQLLANPGQFLSNPLFTSTLNVGTTAVNRSQAAQGFLGSGNQATALQQFGQSFASGQLLGQETLLAGLSGAGSASSPSQAVSAATSAQGQSFNQLGSLLASLGYATGGSGGAPTGGDSGTWAGGAAGSDPWAGLTTGGYIN